METTMHCHFPLATGLRGVLISLAALLVLGGGCINDQLPDRGAYPNDRMADAPRGRIASTNPVQSSDPLVRTALAVPSGNVSTSVILVEKLGPREARLNRPYDYRIR